MPISISTPRRSEAKPRQHLSAKDGANVLSVHVHHGDLTRATSWPLETGKLLLRDYVNATVGFEALGAELHKSPKSLMRMLSKEGNPRAANLFAVVSHLKSHEGVSFSVRSSTGPQ